jgi:hypothetical protein
MKPIAAQTAVVSALVCSAANAASVTMIPSFSSHAWSMYLDGQEADGNFDRVFVRILPLTSPYAPAFRFFNQSSGLSSGTPRPPGQTLSYRNRILDADPNDPLVPGGLGWTIDDAVNTPNELSFRGGPLGGKIDTGNPTRGAPGLFLANVFTYDVPSGGTYQVQIFNDGALVQELSDRFLEAEPSTSILGGFALLICAAILRRFA